MEQLQGLILYNDVISKDDKNKIIEYLDNKTWSNVLKRRTQHYGYEYNYKSKNPKPTQPLAGPLLEIANLLKDQNIIDANQCIVNEYTRDQGISRHIDVPIFGPIIVSLSLLEPTTMVFSNNDESHNVTLLPRSLLVMKDNIRYKWFHSIPITKKVLLNDDTIYYKPNNYRRISLTYRVVI